MIGLIVLTLLCGGVSAGSHWYRYFYTWVSGATGFPEFVSVGYLDDKELNYYESGMKEEVPRHRIMELAADPDFYRRNTQISRGSEQVGKVGLQIALTRTNQSGGIHTFQMMSGCELRDDGTTGGFEQYGWDGKDFISFDKEQLQWVTPVHWGEITKRKWDRNTAFNQEKKGYLEQVCIEWLKKYLQLGERDLRAVAPAVSFTRLGDARRLSCVATGFYPQAIEVTLRRDGKFLDETLSNGILPNHDGTYQINRWTEFDPEEKSRFSCEVEHGGLEEKVIVFYVPKPVSQVSIIVGVVLGLALVILLGIVAVVIYKKKVGKESGYNPAKTSDKGESSSNSSVPT